MSRWRDGVRNEHIEQVTASTEVLRRRLREHPIYGSLPDVQAVQKFMETHVFAVWDFMSLLKSLQLHFTCTQVPWRSVGDATVRRFVNELVVGEESDEHPSGGYTSHFDLYLEAMTQAGCDTAPIRAVAEAAAAGEDVAATMRAWDVPAYVIDFVAFDLEVAMRAEPHEVAAVFTFGREDLIPAMFSQLTRAARQDPARLGLFEAYLERHIALDGDVHAPMAFRMISVLCGDDPAKWADVVASATRAIQLRLALWDGLLAELHTFAAVGGSHRATPGVGVRS